MEIRCGNCSKLFRVSDDKITGKGIKFACTRCGEYVKITREDFENYTLSMTAVAALDMFEPTPRPSTAPLEAEAPLAAAPYETPEPAFTEAPDAEDTTTEPGSDDAEPSFDLDFLREREAPAGFEEPLSTEQPEPGSETEFPAPHAEQEAPLTEAQSETSFEAALQVEMETGSDLQPGQELTLEQPLESQPEPQPIPVIFQDSSPGSAPQPAAMPQQEQAPAPQSRTELEAPRMPEPVRTQDAVPQAAPAEAEKKFVRPASPAPGKTTPKATPIAPARSGRMAMLIALTLVILGLAGAGAFVYLQQPAQVAPVATESTPKTITPEGLQITDSTASFEQNGDLLISGVVENTTDRDRRAWLIVVEVLDAKGSVVGRIRMLNGKQIYTRSDYEILAKRGSDVQDLKARTLEGPDIILPPKGKAPFEMRYLQPPASVASFIPTLLPFDQARMLHEIEMETK